MYLNRLELRDWRSYREAVVEFDPAVNLITGENAQGKTNLLEAVGYLSSGSSFRTRTASELTRFGADLTELNADFFSGGRERSLRVGLISGRRKILELSGVKKKNWSELENPLRTVIFCPEDLSVLRGGADARRRVLDRLLCQLRPAYAAALTEYNRVIERKGRILRDRAEDPSLAELLPEYNDRAARYGAVLIGYRDACVRALDEIARRYTDELSGGREQLRLEYRTVSCVPDPLPDRETLTGLLREHLARRLPAELESGSCLSGPHKDDFFALLGDLSLKSYGSQGQTRTAAIALKLAEREMHRRDCGEEPLLLLDDVLSELDPMRQDYVIRRLGSGQVLITCCDDRGLTGLGRQYRIQGGEITCM